MCAKINKNFGYILFGAQELECASFGAYIESYPASFDEGIVVGFVMAHGKIVGNGDVQVFKGGVEDVEDGIARVLITTIYESAHDNAIYIVYYAVEDEMVQHSFYFFDVFSDVLNEDYGILSVNCLEEIEVGGNQTLIDTHISTYENALRRAVIVKMVRRVVICWKGAEKKVFEHKGD